MTETSVIPTPSTPDVCAITVSIGGQEISGEFHVLSATVSAELNRVPSASLQLRDGDPAEQTFAASDTEHFLPGKEVEIRLGYGGSTDSVFSGIIVKHRIRVRPNATYLSLECRDKAMRMTLSQQSRYFEDTTDSDIIEELLDDSGLDAEVSPTTPQLAEVVQYDSTDWDFMVCRAEANGHVVAVRDGRVKVGPPDVDADPAVTVQYGATVLELDAEIDARWQPPGRTATAWNSANQALTETEASEPSVTASGNLAASDLAEDVGSDPRMLRHAGALSEPELQAWADGRLSRDRFAKVRGRVRFQGFAGVHPGDVIEVAGIGDRFAGNQFVSGVRHTLADGNWETDVAFGLSPKTHSQVYPVNAQPAGGLLPSVSGLQVGVVSALGGDPAGEDRIRVRLPLVDAEGDGVWARLATLDAGDGRGTFFRPDIGDEVVVGFLGSDPRFPVVLGQTHSSAKPAPQPGDDDNHVKGYVSRSGMQLTFDDENTVVALETPAGNILLLSEDDESVALADQNGNKITLDVDGITIESAKDLVLKAAGDVSLEGINVSLAAQSSLSAEGQSGVEIKSSGTLGIQGSLVQIN